mgnify:CR=1 FL=1
MLFIKLSVVSRISCRGTGHAAYFSTTTTMTFDGGVCSSGSSGRPGVSGCCVSSGSSGSPGSSGTRGTSGASSVLRSAVGGAGSTSGSGSGVGTISEPGIVVVGAVGSGSGVGSSSDPGIVVLGAVLSGADSAWGSEVNNEDVVVGAVGSAGVGSEDSGSGSGVCLSVEVVVCAGSVVCVVREGSADDEDVEVAVGSFAASCGAGSELEDGAAAGVEAGVDSTLLAAAAAAAVAAEEAREIAWEAWPWCSPRCLSWWPTAGVVARSV